MFYRIKNNELYDYADFHYSVECFKTDIITQAELDEHKNKVIVVDDELVLNPNYDEEEAEKERERIAQLHLTRGDVFRGLLLARQVTRQQIRALIEAMPDDTPEQQIAKEYALIDFDESLDFYRGVALIDTLGLQLGISSEAMTQFFETNDWHYLVPDTRVNNETTSD